MRRSIVNAVIDVAHQKFHWNGRQLAGVYGNSVQAQGVLTEDVFKDLLAGVTDSLLFKRELVLDSHLSWQGSSNNPPDIILRGGNAGDAFEIKKADSSSNELQLNSSPPYSHLSVTNPRITEKCRELEGGWKLRDFFYGFGKGLKPDKNGNNFWLIQGPVFANDYTYYEGVLSDMQRLIRTDITDLGFSSPASTNELGRLEGLDGRQKGRGGVKLRVRGMWLLKNPIKDFLALPGVDESAENYLTLHIVLLTSKWMSLLTAASDEERAFLASGDPHLSISRFEIDDPHRKGEMLDCTLIRVFEEAI